MTKPKDKRKLLDNYGDYVTPQLLLEVLDDTIEEFVNSNYHTNRLHLVQGIVRDWAKDNGIELGPTRAEREAMQAKASREENLKFYTRLGLPADRAKAYMDGEITVEELMESLRR